MQFPHSIFPGTTHKFTKLFYETLTTLAIPGLGICPVSIELGHRLCCMIKPLIQILILKTPVFTTQKNLGQTFGDTPWLAHFKVLDKSPKLVLTGPGSCSEWAHSDPEGVCKITQTLTALSCTWQCPLEENQEWPWAKSDGIWPHLEMWEPKKRATSQIGLAWS